MTRERNESRNEFGGIDWRRCPQVCRDPEVMSGAWRFVGTRVPLWVLFGNLADGMDIGEFCEQFPEAGRTNVQAVLQFQADEFEAARLPVCT